MTAVHLPLADLSFGADSEGRTRAETLATSHTTTILYPRGLDDAVRVERTPPWFKAK